MSEPNNKKTNQSLFFTGHISHQECRGAPESSVNTLPGLWTSKIQAFLQRAEILLVRRDWAADVHRHAQASFYFLHGLCNINSFYLVLDVEGFAELFSSSLIHVYCICTFTS